MPDTLQQKQPPSSLSQQNSKTMASTSPLLLRPLSLLLLLASAITASPSPSPPPTPGCSAELVAFSPCLPFVASAPNNISSSPSPGCCAVFSSAFDNRSAAAGCLCYPTRRRAFFGFPLNSTRLFALSSLCPLANRAGSRARGSLRSLCSGLSTLPPLQAIIGPVIPRTRNSGPDRSSPPVNSSLMPDSDGVSDATPSPSTTTPTNFQATHSSASNQLNKRSYCSPLRTIAFLVSIFTVIFCHPLLILSM